jgi:hypothetical protein
LYEGLRRWRLPGVAKAVPGLLRICVFLFFAGLCESLLNTNEEAALCTIPFIGISTLLYIIMVLAPIMDPQSPYHDSFSGMVWFYFQMLRGRKTRSHGEMRPVSTHMEEGKMHLAMEETMARKDRDVEATRWLINNLTEDAEMEKFLLAIPGSFNTNWGTEVWKRVGEYHESEDQSQDETVAKPRRDTTAHQPSSSWSIRSVIRPIIHLIRKPTSRHFLPRQGPLMFPHTLRPRISKERMLYTSST